MTRKEDITLTACMHARVHSFYIRIVSPAEINTSAVMAPRKQMSYTLNTVLSIAGTATSERSFCSTNEPRMRAKDRLPLP